MLLVGIILLFLASIGAIYIFTILFFARRIQKKEYYHAEKRLEEWDFWKVEGMNLNFVEQVTKELTKNGFRWIDDYKLEEQDSKLLKLSKHYNASVEAYARYFVSDIESTVASIAFYKVYKHKEFDRSIDKVSCMHYFSLETALKDNKHIQSGLIYEPSIGAEVLTELIEGPQTEVKIYNEEGEVSSLIQSHLEWVHQYSELLGIDPIVTIKPLDEVMQCWWDRAYHMRKMIYYYDEIAACYKLKLSYCIKVVMCYPFFKLNKYVA